MHLLTVEAEALHADDVEAGEARTITERHAVRDDIVFDTGEATDKRMVPDAGELVDASAAADDDKVANGTMSGQHDVVGEHDVVADMAIVAHMAAGEKGAVITNAGDVPAAGRAGVHGHTFADRTIGADRQRNVLALVFQILRFVAERCERKRARVFTDRGAPGDGDMAQQLDAGLQYHLGANVAERSNVDAGTDLRAFFNHGTGVDLRLF